MLLPPAVMTKVGRGYTGVDTQIKKGALSLAEGNKQRVSTTMYVDRSALMCRRTVKV